MPREQFVNIASTTLDGMIDDTVTLLTVTDASAFPAGGNFRIRVEDEIMLVTAVAGNDFTIERGAEGSTADSHVDTLAVDHVITAGALVAIGRGSDPYFESDRLMGLYDINGNPRTSSDFTQLNFSNASVSDHNGLITIRHAVQIGAEDVAALVKTAPSAPYIVTAGFKMTFIMAGSAASNAGLCIRDSSSGKIIGLALNIHSTVGEGPLLSVWKWDSPTSFFGGALGRSAMLAFDTIWFRIEDNNTNLIFSVSHDGINFIQVFTEVRTTFLANPNSIGFYVNNYNNNVFEALATLVSWKEE